jgi:hypothetical protein
MKNSEEAIDKVLAGLQEVETPVGLEQRILSGLEARALKQAESGWRRFAPGWRGALVCYAACGVLSAGVLIVALAVPAIRRIGHVFEGAKMDVPSEVPFETGSDVAARQNGNASLAASNRSTKTAPTVGSGLMLVAESGVGSGAEESLAMSEMQAASFPAPPMPLTEQERLLLRMVHRTDPVELAMLDPKLEAIRDAEEKAEFQSFFAKAVVKQSTAEQEQAPIEQSATEQTEQSNTEQPTSGAPAEEPGAQRSMKPTTTQDGATESKKTTETTEAGPPPSTKYDN